jgi:hypothetical protein
MDCILEGVWAGSKVQGFGFLDRICRILWIFIFVFLFFSQFPDETEKTQSAWGGE